MERLLRAVSLLALVAPTFLACSGASEQSIVTQFFNASRLRDNTSLDTLATVIFDPRTQGTVTTFTVETISPEQRKPLPLKTLAKAQDDAKAEKQMIDLSVNAGRTAIDVTKYDGETASKDVTVSAPVRLPDGTTVQKTLVVTLQRAILKGDKEITGRWVVTGCRDASAPAATKTS